MLSQTSVPRTVAPRSRPAVRQRRAHAVAVAQHGSDDLKKWNQQCKTDRIRALETQLKVDLLETAARFDHPVFTWAAIAGDNVLLRALADTGLLKRVPVVYIDTLHLFPETHAFLETMEKTYGFKALRYHPQGAATKQEWNKVFTSDMYMTDPDKYDQLAKVEPLARALKELQVDAWINGRRRDHGAERAALPVFEEGSPVKVNPIAFWTFEDCFDFLELTGTPAHPLHAEGYPSVGDVHSTLPVPREKWFEYAGERKGRFQGLNNSDGSEKTECGIHNKMGAAAESSSLIGGGGAPASSGLKPPASSGLKPPASSGLKPPGK